MFELKTDHWGSCWFNKRLSKTSLFMKSSHYLYYHCIFPYVASLALTRLQTNYYDKSLLKQVVSFFMAEGLLSKAECHTEHRSNMQLI